VLELLYLRALVPVSGVTRIPNCKHDPGMASSPDTAQLVLSTLAAIFRGGIAARLNEIDDGHRGEELVQRTQCRIR
jgi:hypothetical protein